MTLEQRVREIRILVLILEGGWDNKTIFTKPVNNLYNPETNTEFSLNPGWGLVIDSILELLFQSRQIGLHKLKDTACSPELISNIVREAKGFISLFQMKSR